MKVFCVLVLFMHCILLNAQAIRIESEYLDSLVWSKINRYRKEKGVNPFDFFEDSLMRSFCKRVTVRNTSVSNPVHSDSVGYWSNAECLYTHISSGFLAKELITESRNEMYEFLAEKTVQAWIHSPTHERLIAKAEFNIATIVTIIQIDPLKEVIRLDATYHALDKEHNTFNRYVYR